jgi:cytochrome P450
VSSSELFYDPFADLGPADPYPAYRRLREEAPLYHNPDRDFWALSRYDDVQAASRDWKTFSSADGVDPDYVGVRLGLNSFLDMDPPRHDILRKIIREHFNPNTVNEIEGFASRASTNLLDNLIPAGTADLAAEFAWVVPLIITAGLLGLPPEDHDQLQATFDSLWIDNRLWAEPAVDSHARVSAAELREYFASKISARRLSPPGSDVLSTVADAHAAGVAGLDDLAEVCILVYIAGYETTANLIANSLLHLAENPLQRERLAAEPNGLPVAVEELLRFDAPVQMLARNATTTVALHGRELPAGSRVLLVYGAANRDHRRFRDPDRLDLARPVVRHLAFGDGIHHCLGAPLARLEARVALRHVLARIPNYEVSGTVVWNTHQVATRGIASLPARFEAVA